MLDRVDLNLIRQLQLAGLGGDNRNDLAGPDAAVAKFAAWAAGDNILGVEPYTVFFLEG